MNENDVKRVREEVLNIKESRNLLAQLLCRFTITWNESHYITMVTEANFGSNS